MSAPNWIKTVTMQSVTSAESTMAHTRYMTVMMSAGRSINQKRKGLILALLLLSSVPAFAQGTVMPPPVFTGLDASGNPLVSGKLCTYVAGTTTPATTYTTSALSPLAVNTNPVILDAAGRAIVFLRPGSSYKFVLYSAGSDTTCSTGTLQWSVDNISALPSSNVNLDIDGTAGESLAAGDVVYLSDGTGSRTQGSWYKADADLTYASTAARAIGMAPSAIASGSSGTIRTAGVVTVTGPLSSGLPYYVSATAGGLTAAPPTNAIRVGGALTSTTILLGYTQAPVSPRGPPCGRLTLTSGLPVTISDVTAATTVYYTPAGFCNTLDLYDGTAWTTYALAELSIAVPATTNTAYDVFAYDNAGVVALELTAWTNLTTRATALVLQNGVYAKTGALTRRYLGSFRTTGVSGQTEDSATKRYLFNADNRALRQVAGAFVTGTYNYTTNTFQQFNGGTTIQFEVFVGLADSGLEATVVNWAYNGGATITAQIAIGEDSNTAAVTGIMGGASQVGALQMLVATLRKVPAVGSHTYSAIERSGAAGTTAWGPNANAMNAGGNAGITGLWKS